MFLDQYLEENKISSADYKAGYLPRLMAFNQNSSSTPCRLVHQPNRGGICRYPNHTDLFPQGGHAEANPVNYETDLSIMPRCHSYNECIKIYNLTLLKPN